MAPRNRPSDIVERNETSFVHAFGTIRRFDRRHHIDSRVAHGVTYLSPYLVFSFADVLLCDNR